MSTRSVPRNLVSLRNRFKQLAVILVVMICAGAYFGYMNLSSTRNVIETNLVERNEQLEETHIIRALLLDTYRSLDSFLLEPSQPEYRDNIFVSIREAKFYTNKLLEVADGSDDIDAADVSMLVDTLELLEDAADELIETRLDSSRQYPSLAVGDRIMQPNRDRANNFIAVAINALQGEERLDEHPEVLGQFIKVRHTWSKMLSNFRLYLANRVGSFNENSLPVQENSIDTLYRQFHEETAVIAAFVEQDITGFETSDAYAELLAAVENWYKGFAEVKVIHHTSNWRIDAKLMKQKLAPAIQLASNQLRHINDHLVAAAERDIATLDRVAEQQILILWGIAAVGVIFIIVVIFTTERLVFAPISVIAGALKGQALGRKNLELPAVTSAETRDLTEAFNEMSRQIGLRQSELEYRALHDSLTSLPNRTLLYENINHDINIARRDGKCLALMIIDLDRFKEVNDTLGHQVGDQLLVDVGHRLKHGLREVDTVARMGGDEFAVLLPDVNVEQAELVATKLIDVSQQPYEINDMRLAASASIGIAMFPEHGEDVESLLRHADVAMYIAKQNRYGYSMYDPQQDEYSVKRIAMISDLRDAIEGGGLELYYQPKLDIKSGAVYGVEALLRWQHPEHGFVSPEQVVGMAEHTGMISALSYWVIERALRQTGSWHEHGIDLDVSVNISAHNLRDVEFVGRVKEIVARTGFSCGKLTFEITENAMMENPARAIDILGEFDRMGIRLAVDDYGTGFSSLSYLSRLPVSELKIDKSFVHDIEHDNSHETIVRSTVELAHNLGLEVVAEGIENQLTWNLLRSFGCDHGQGFYMSKPLPVDELERWLEVFKARSA